MPNFNINAMTGDQVKNHFLATLNYPADPIYEATNQSNWIYLRASKPWVYTQALTEGEEYTSLNDGDHILLFPQDETGLCPRSWFNAAWTYLETFRSNFSFFPKEAEFYYHITLVGKATGNRYGISSEIEALLRSETRRKITRIECANADELSEALSRRITAGVAFLEE
jgi:hypothetical protein